MLAALRRIIRSPIMLVIIIAPLVVGFAIFGVSDVFVRTGDAVAVVGPERVSRIDLARAFDQRLRLEQRENPALTAETARTTGLGDQVLNEEIIAARIRAIADEMNLAVSDAQIRNEINGFQVFLDPVTGGHDNQAYLSYLADQRMTPAQFEAEIGENMVRGQLIDALFAGIRTPEAYGDVIDRFSNERRSFRALVIPPQAAGDIGDPEDAALQSVIDENPQFFTEPERRSFTLIRFRVADFTANVTVDEADIREQYDYEIETGQTGEPATRSFTQLRFDDGETARAAVERLNAGESATAIAADLGADAPFVQTDRQEYQIPDEAVAEALFAMGEGEAAAIEGRLGWFVVHVDAAQDATLPDYAERRIEIRDLMARSEAENAMYDAMGEYESALSGGATIEEAAEAAGIPYEMFAPIDAENRTADGQYAFSFFEQPEILEAVFEQTPGVETELQPYGDGDYYAFRVESVTPSRVQDLDDVRDQATTVWRLQTVDEQLDSIVEDARQRARDGEPLDAIAASIEGARVESASLTRSETAAPFGRDAVGAAFFIDVGDVQEARGSDNRSRLIIVLDSVETGQSDDPEIIFEMRSQLAEQIQRDLDTSLAAALAQRYPARIDTLLRDQALGVIDPNQLQ